MSLIPGLEIGSFAPMMSQVIYWTAYSLLGLITALGLYSLYYYTSFNIKLTVWPLYGSGKDGIFSIGKEKHNRVKWIKNKTAWKSMFPLFNRKEREPFDADYLFPGNKAYAFEINGELFPAKINVNSAGKKVTGEISPVPYMVRNWQALEHKQNAIDFAKHDWFTDNKAFIWMLISVAICCALCGATIYFTYQFASGGTQSMNALAKAIEGMTQGVGQPLG